MTVRDDSGTLTASASDDCIVRINAAPVANAGGNQEGFFGGAHDMIYFNAGGSSDSDGDPLTYFWDFGDKSTAIGQQAYHSYITPGTYTVRLKVSDGLGVKNSEDWDEIAVVIRAH